VVREAAPGNYKLTSLIVGIVKSAPFQMNMKVEEANAPRQTASLAAGDGKISK
jgi:hypothetical protein